MSNVLQALRPIGLLVLFGAILTTSGCKPKETITRRTLSNRSPNHLLLRLQYPTQHLEWYSAKVATRINKDGKENTFKTAVKMRKDSLLWASLSPALGIEIVRAVISADSVKYINKLYDQYFIGGLAGISDKVNTEISLQQLQSLFLGEALEFDPKDKFNSSVEGYRYVLSSKTKKKFVRAAEEQDMFTDSTQSYLPGYNERRLERLSEKKEERLIVRKYYISPESYLITEIKIVDLVNEQVLEVEYSDHELVDGWLLPHKVTFFASSGDRSLRVEMDISKVKVNEPRTMPFKIPEKYERIY